MGADSLTIGQLAGLSSTPITTLRYYERKGLLDPPERVSGQRRYDPAVLMRLMVIRFCKSAGLSLDEIGAVLRDHSPGRTVTKEIAAQRIAAIDEQVAELEIARMLMTSAISCRCQSVEECRCGAMDEAVAVLVERALVEDGVRRETTPDDAP